MKHYLIDNQRYSILQFFRDNANKYNNICIATGYIDLPALNNILPLIQHYKSIRILIGQEPLIRRYKKETIESDFPKFDIANDLEELAIDIKYAHTIEQIKTLIQDKKLQIKIFKKTFLHAKCYILSDQTKPDTLNTAIGIIGSSNLTINGISSNKNIELNHIEHNEMIVKYPATDKEPNLIGHYAWFNQLWNDQKSENWEGQFTNILDMSPVGELMFSQYEMYIKTLWEIYRDEIEVTGEQISKGYKLFEYQLKNANSLCKRLEKRKLAMLCDSVGLGKTITALEVITRYINNSKRVVVISPKSLQHQWEHAIRKQNLNLDVISLQNEGELNKHIEYDRYAPVGLFVIDESHNLRTGSTSSRFVLVRQWINKNKNAHSLLLTATPINNSITDLLNQILLGSGGDANVLMIPTSNGRGMRNVVDVINSIQKSENSLKELTPELISKRRAKLHPIIKEFVVRRTRQGILREQEVSNFEPKLKFPQEKLQARSYSFADDLSNIIIQKTTNSNLGSINKLNINEIIKKIYLLKELYTEYDEAKKDYIEKTIDNDLNLLIHPIDQLDNFTQLHSETYLATSSPLRLVYQIIQFLGFIPYRYMIYHQNFYGKDTADLQSLPQTPANKVLNRQKGIYGLLRIVFLKRLESSFYALKRSLANYRNNLERFKYALNNGIIQPISKIKKLFDEYTDNDDYNINFINKDTELTEEFNFAEFNHEIMQVDIEKELKLLDILDIQLELLERHDNKIKDLAELFKDIQTNHLEYNNGKPKILVFSYFLDTIKYLEENFKNYYHYNENECAFINSSNRNNIDGLTRRFAPKAKDYQLKPGEQELRFLFATDVLSEGQNLQDCAILINYDLHWNPVRMIQRNGRINRIGSENDTVLIYNMYPNSQLEEYLKLVRRLDYKIGLIRDIVGQDQRILNSDENLNFIEFVDDIEITKLQDLYSDNEEKANKILTELEDDAEYLTDDKFIADLRYFDNKYKHNPKYKEEIYSIPRGKFGLLKDNKKPEQLLMFTQINNAYNNKLFNKFFMIDLSKNKPTSKGIDDLTALQLICTDENNNQRQISKTYTRYISCLTKEFLQTHIETLQSSNNNTHRDLGTKMINLRKKFLHLLVEIGYSEEERNTFDRALLYSNHLDFEIIIKHIRKILKKPTTNEIDELLEICKKSIIGLDEEKKVIQPAICEGILYYGN